MSESNIGFVARAQAFFNQFPFIARYVTWGAMNERPRVQRIDLDLLDRLAYQGGWMNLDKLPRHPYSVQFIVLDTQGNELVEVQPCRVEYERAHFAWAIPYKKARRIEGESVYQAIVRLQRMDIVGYVLEITNRWGFKKSHINVVVHKTPNGVPFNEWIGDLDKIAQRELWERLAEVDSR